MNIALTQHQLKPNFTSFTTGDISCRAVALYLTFSFHIVVLYPPHIDLHMGRVDITEVNEAGSLFSISSNNTCIPKCE